MTRGRGKKIPPQKTVKFRENDRVKFNANCQVIPQIIGATGIVTRGSFGRKNSYIYVNVEDLAAVEKHLHGDPQVLVLPHEIDHLPREVK